MAITIGYIPPKPKTKDRKQPPTEPPTAKE